MERENRYIVLKLTDVETAISPCGRDHLARLCKHVEQYREKAGKAPLACAVVESDWPEYEPVWRAIEARVDGTPASLIQEVVNEPNVDAALRSFSEDPTNDNAFFLIREIMGKCLPRVQAKAPPAAAPVDLDKKIAEIEAEADMVVVPRGVLGAAGSAIDKKRDAPTVLALLRHYSTGSGVRKPEVALPKGIEIYANGDANSYTMLKDGKNWLAQIQMNGEMTVPQHWALLRSLLANYTPLPAPEPVGYFAYSDDAGYEEFETPEAAKTQAQEEIEYYRGDACDGWPEAVDNVCWGVIMQRSKSFNEQEVPEGTSRHISGLCDYRLEPVLPGEGNDA